MPFWKKAAAQSEVEQHNHDSDIVSALKRNLAYIEFDPQGKILDANATFFERNGVHQRRSDWSTSQNFL